MSDWTIYSTAPVGTPAADFWSRELLSMVTAPSLLQRLLSNRTVCLWAIRIEQFRCPLPVKVGRLPEELSGYKKFLSFLGALLKVKGADIRE